MREFFESSPSRNAAASSEPTVAADFEVMRQRLLDCLDSFTRFLCNNFAVRLYSDNTYMMRKCDGMLFVVRLVFLPHFDILRLLSEYRPTAKSELYYFVLYLYNNQDIL